MPHIGSIFSRSRAWRRLTHIHSAIRRAHLRDPAGTTTANVESRGRIHVNFNYNIKHILLCPPPRRLRASAGPSPGQVRAIAGMHPPHLRGISGTPSRPARGCIEGVSKEYRRCAGVGPGMPRSWPGGGPEMGRGRPRFVLSLNYYFIIYINSHLIMRPLYFKACHGIAFQWLTGRDEVGKSER